MRRLLRLLAPLAKPRIATSVDLVRYVVLVTAVGIAVALSLDITTQLIFFVDWTSAIRSWAITVVDALITAVPISLLIGRSQRELYHANLRVEELSRTDFLTGLPNRRALMECVDDHTLQMMVLVIVDIDRFKIVNDTYGHRAGDTVIKTVGEIMAAHLRPVGTVGRLGGEEFAVIAPALLMKAVLARLIAFRQQMEHTPVVADGISVSVTISAGVAIRGPSEPFDRLYMDADEALYLAKRLGRNRIELSPRIKAAGFDASVRDQLTAA